jgi:hypothetical protein
VQRGVCSDCSWGKGGVCCSCEVHDTDVCLFSPAWSLCKRMPRSDVRWVCVCWIELEESGTLEESGRCTRKKCSTFCEDGARWVVLLIRGGCRFVSYHY